MTHAARSLVRFLPPLALVLGFAPCAALHGQANYAAPYAFTTLTTNGNPPVSASSLAVDAAGNLYVANGGLDSIVQKITPAGAVTTLAHIPLVFQASYFGPNALAVDRAGNVFVADGGNNRILEITPTGAVTPFAGTSTPNPQLPRLFPLGPSFGSIPDPSNEGYADGATTQARFKFPLGVAVDDSGNVFVCDAGNRTLRKITPAGTVSTLAGSPSPGGGFGGMQGLAVDAAGNVFVADFGLNSIRKISPAGVLTTIAGDPFLTTQGIADGPAATARFLDPTGLAVDAAGNVFVTDIGAHTIREVSASGIVTTLAGLAGNPGDINATGRAARFKYPYGIAVSPSGLLFVADTGNGAIRVGTLAPPPVAPAILTPPFSAVAPAGGTVVFTVAASGANLNYQWRKNSAPIAGATRATLLFSAVTAADAASYSVVVANDAGTIESAPATLALASTPARSRLVNLSVRSRAGSGDQTLIAGLVVGGSGPEPLLLRGVGPALVPLGVSDALLDPQIHLFNATGGQLDQNDNWGGGAPLAAAFAALGAGALPPASRDAALLESLPAGPYSLHVTSNAGAGVALVEVYDGAPNGSPARLVNVSARSNVGLGDDVLIAGFVIAGPTSLTVLLRGVGPTLVPLGVSGALVDPQLKLFDASGRIIFENDNWGGDSTLAGISAAIGASPLPPASKDAAILITLPPGVYSAHVSGVGATTGVALIEAYEVQ